jgi:molybdopterin synthase sulfur carrier subunit
VNYRILYFASLRDAAGRDAEAVAADTHDARELYAQRQREHGFAMSADRLRVAINGEFAAWNRPLADGDENAFLPPVSGG